MVSQSWKAHERFVAKALQGFRIPRGANFSRSLPDVVSDAKLSLPSMEGLIFTECKYSVSNPWVNYISSKYEGKPLLVTNKDKTDILVCTQLEDLHNIKSSNLYKQSKIIRNIPKYIFDNLEQCRGYIDIILADALNRATITALTGLTMREPILPIVCIAEKRKTFRLCYTSLRDIEVFNINNDKSKGRI